MRATATTGVTVRKYRNPFGCNVIHKWKESQVAERVSTADSSGNVKVQSPQQEPKAKGSAASPSAKRAAVSEPKVALGSQGRPVTKFSDEAINPNDRVHVGEDPTGKKNVKK